MKRQLLFHIIAALCLVMSLYLAAKPAQAQRNFSIPCRLLNLTCPAEHTGESRWSKLPPDTGIEVINNSAHTLSVAYGWYEFGKTAQPIGDFTLPVLLSNYWAAQGWSKVQPHGSYTFYPPALNLEAYVRIEADGKAISPPNFTAMHEFCVAAHNFISKSQIDAKWYVIGDGQGGVHSGQNCANAGGEWRTFYKMPRMTSFAVN